MALSSRQLSYINLVGELGTPHLASEKMEVNYIEYKEWYNDEEFREEIRDAKRYYRDNVNETIAVLAKRELLKILLNGIIEVSTSFKSIADAEGNVTGQERTVKRTHKGVPSWAIKEGLALIPEIIKIYEARAAYNAVSPDELERVKIATKEYEKTLRAIGDGEGKVSEHITDDMIAMIQSSLIGG